MNLKPQTTTPKATPTRGGRKASWGSFMTFRCATLLLGLTLPLMGAGQPPKKVITIKGEMVVGSDDRPVLLYNNPSAVDVSLEEVLALIRAETSNQLPYKDRNFTCVDYAERIHTAAEQQGIRAGVAHLEYSHPPGHIINIFNTTDKGIVFIDCTGDKAGDPKNRNDSIGYLKIGLPYGRLNIEVGKVRPNDYGYYAQIKKATQQVDLLGKLIDQQNAAYAREAEVAKELARTACTNDERAECDEIFRNLQAKRAAIQAQCDQYNRLVVIRNHTFKDTSDPVTQIDIRW